MIVCREQNGAIISCSPRLLAAGGRPSGWIFRGLLSGFGSFTINVDLATEGEMLGVFGSNAAGIALFGAGLLRKRRSCPVRAR